MTNVHIRERRDSDLTILDLTSGFAFGFREAAFGLVVEQLLERRQNQIILNLSRFQVVDAAWLGELIRVRERVLESSGQLKMCELNERILELMTLSKLLPVFEIFNDERLATASFQIRRHRKTVYRPERSETRSKRDRLKIF